MAPTRRNRASEAWSLARSQHGVVARGQLLDLGLTPEAIKHRLERGRLFSLHRAVYAVGTPVVSQLGRWTAAVLAGGPGAVLSHQSAGELWGLTPARSSAVHVTVPTRTHRRARGVAVHHRDLRPGEVTSRHQIPVASPALTLVDLATVLRRDALEAAVNAADKLGLASPPELREQLATMSRRPGLGRLRNLLDAHEFRLTDSALERLFLGLVREAGLPPPKTRSFIEGFRVDFHWPQWRLIVETDGLRYHRTAVQQARDRRRDQRHAAAGLTTLRFTHQQVAHEPDDVRSVLLSVIERCRPDLSRG